MNAANRTHGARRWWRRNSPVLSLFLLAAAQAGCGDVQANWERAGQTRSAPARSATPPSPAAVAPPAIAPASEPASRPAVESPVPPQDYLQLALVNEAVPTNVPPNFVYVRLEKAPPAAAAEILRRLYLPIGVHGVDRCVLIYGVAAECQGAAELARSLDLTPVADVPTGGSLGAVEAFREAAAAYMGHRRGAVADRQALLALEPVLGELAVRPDASPAVRWAAGMLAGDICATLSSDFNRAEQFFLAAESQTPPGSVERMNVLLARARAHAAAGRKDRATLLFGSIVSQFTAFRRAEAYVRARAGLDEQRP